MLTKAAYVPIDRETKTVDGTTGGVSLTASKLVPRVAYALCQCLGAAIRVTVDGTAPVGATTGVKFESGQFFELWGPSMSAARFIRESTTSGSLEVIYFGKGG